MDLKEFIYGLVILIIPLILLLLIHRLYITYKCHNNKECIKRKILFDIEDVSNKLNKNIDFIKKNRNNEEEENVKIENNSEEVIEEEIEGFFGGIADYLYGKAYGNVEDTNSENKDLENKNPIESNSSDNLKLNNNDGGIPELKTKFPVGEMNDSDNNDLLKSINEKRSLLNNSKKIKLTNNNLKKVNSEIQSEINKKTNKDLVENEAIKSNKNIIQEDVKENNKIISKFSPEIINDKKILKNESEMVENKSNISSLFNKCNFYSDKCPEGYQDFGSIGLSGPENKGMMLSCGNVENTKPGKAIARIKDNSIEEVVILDKGHGYNPLKPPKVEVVGGKGNGGQCEAVIDDEGYLSLIKIIHPGNYYTETPNIIIEPPLMNSNCHFCCK